MKPRPIESMTTRQYCAALLAAGIPSGLSNHELDRQAAALLEATLRTVRRYRNGESRIPGPVKVALEALARERTEAPCPSPPSP